MLTINRKADISAPLLATPGEPILDLEAFQSVLSQRLHRHLGGDGLVEFRGVVSGNINRIYRFRYCGRELGVRVAVNRARFRYEKDIIKEVFAILLLQYARPGQCGELARRIVDGMLASPSGSHVGHAAVRAILCYDWSMRDFPYPFFVFEWVEGEVLWQAADPAQYAAAGTDLARLHRIGFQSFYRDIFRAGREPMVWHEHFRHALAHELGKARPHLPAEVAGWLAALDVEGMAAPEACFVHNDYAGANIIVEPGGGRRVIDWDNWLIEAAELDLVKMKYWTCIGAGGLLGHDPALYAAFLGGYRHGGGRPIDARRLRAYEALWLLRTFNFESGRGGAGNDDATAWSRVYPGADAYLGHLRALTGMAAA